MLTRIHRLLSAAALLSLSTLGCAQPADKDSAFQAALEAGRANDWSAFDQLLATVDTSHPLMDYLMFHELRRDLPDVPAHAFTRYQAAYPNSPLPQDLLRVAQVAYGKAEQWQDFLTITPSAPSNIERKCYYLQAKKAQGEVSYAMRETLTIWHFGHSRPSSCDPLFDYALEKGHIKDEDIWARQVLAFKANQSGLMRYLNGLYSSDRYQDAGDQLRRVHSAPSITTQQAKQFPSHARDTLVSLAVQRWAQRDNLAASEWISNYPQRRWKNDALRAEAEERVVWYSIIRGNSENRAWVDAWLTDNPIAELVDQRARLAVVEQDWPALLTWVQALPVDQQSSSRWLYWQARAHQALDRPDHANQLIAEAAQHRNFFGMLAAEQLAVPFAMHTADYQPADIDVDLRRIELLQQLGLDSAAWREWRWLLAQHDADVQQHLGYLALTKGWYDLAVEASIRAQAWNTLPIRFPAAHRSQFFTSAAQHNVDPWLSMAIARRESAFNPRAQSPAGALGIMQLMPGTANMMAREAGLARPDREALFDTSLNIDLGSRYLAQVLSDFGNNRILALAAYNAGPHRVTDWLERHQDPLPADVWIEAIPFRETRDYVQAVLTYRALMLSMHTDTSMVRLLTPGEIGTGYYVALLGSCESGREGTILLATC